MSEILRSRSAPVREIAALLAAWMLGAMRGVAPLGLPGPHAPRGVALLMLFFIPWVVIAGKKMP